MSTAEKYILCNNFAGLFRIVRIFGLKKKIPCRIGYATQERDGYGMTLAPLMGEYAVEDCENKVDEAEEPEVTIYTAHNFDGAPPKGTRTTDPLRVGSVMGRQQVSYTLFKKIMQVTGCDPRQIDIDHPKKKDGTPTDPIAIRVYAQESNGQYEPKNGIRAWAKDMGVFIEEDKARAALLIADMETAPPADEEKVNKLDDESAPADEAPAPASKKVRPAKSRKSKAE